VIIRKPIDLKVKDLFPNPFRKGVLGYITSNISDIGTLIDSIFTYFQGNTRDPDYIKYSDLYFNSLYGERKLSCLSVMLLDKTVEEEYHAEIYTIDTPGNFVLSDGKFVVTYKIIEDFISKTLINIISNKYYNKWNKVFETYKLDYDVLSPYNMSITDNTEDTMTSNDKFNTSRDNRQEGTENSTNNDNTQSSVYAYNSATASPNENSTTDTSLNSTTTQNNTTTGNDNRDYTRDNSIKKTITRKGNIGNTLPQEMIERQRKLLDTLLYDIIFKDIAAVISRERYNY
jgi:hypothetical protein